MYNSPKVEINHEEFPKWTIKGRYPEKIITNGVGPGQYANPVYDSQGLVCTLKGNRDQQFVEQTPGPGSYNMKAKNSNIA